LFTWLILSICILFWPVDSDDDWWEDTLVQCVEGHHNYYYLFAYMKLLVFFRWYCRDVFLSTLSSKLLSTLSLHTIIVLFTYCCVNKYILSFKFLKSNLVTTEENFSKKSFFVLSGISQMFQDNNVSSRNTGVSN
jgi:hypothetical protein